MPVNSLSLNLNNSITGHCNPKSSTGRPNQYFLDRQTTPRIYLFPTPENSTDTLIYNALTRIQDARNKNEVINEQVMGVQNFAGKLFEVFLGGGFGGFSGGGGSFGGGGASGDW